MNVSTIICPNCGASTTNLRNCEYCGSLLVRFPMLGLSIDKKKYGSKTNLPSGLVNALQNNLDKQISGKKNNHIRTFIDCPFSGFSLEIVSPQSISELTKFHVPSTFCGEYELLTMPKYQTASMNPSLLVCIRFICPNLLNKIQAPVDPLFSNFFTESIRQHQLFKALSESDLFTHITEPLLTYGNIRYGTCDSYYIDFGADVVGAAQILTQVIGIYTDMSPRQVKLNYRTEVITDEDYNEERRSIALKMRLIGAVYFLFFLIGFSVGLYSLWQGSSDWQTWFIIIGSSIMLVLPIINRKI